MANGSFMDNDGNVNKEKAIAFEDEQRELKRQSKDPRDYDLRIAENPKVPSEALLRITSGIFPQAEILLQTNRVLRSKEIQGLLLHGEIKNNPGKGLEFFVKENAKPVINYPHKDGDDIRGCITMVERPLTTQIHKNGKTITAIPDDVYVVVVDPYYKDEPKGKQSTISLGAVYVVKQTSIYFNNKTEQDVAWFVGRPGKTSDLFEIIMNLADFYNAKIQCEISGGGQGLVDYARERKKLHKLMFEPIYINEKEVEKISKNRSFFMNIGTEEKRLGLQYLADDLKTVVGLDENGHEIMKLHYIYDLGYLQELKSFNEDGNFDRISAQIVKMFTLKERIQEKVKRKEKKPNTGIFGRRPLFQDSNKGGQDKFLMLNDLM
jgi:hypothetical protein